MKLNGTGMNIIEGRERLRQEIHINIPFQSDDQYAGLAQLPISLSKVHPYISTAINTVQDSKSTDGIRQKSIPLGIHTSTNLDCRNQWHYTHLHSHLYHHTQQ